MKHILNRLINQENISSEEAKNVLVNISKGSYNQSQIASFLTVYMMRSITLNELEGFRNALLELCIPINLSEYDTIDLCGTGGDGQDTFNISTLASFVTAASGVNVAKHGNYGVSSASGSSNVMEYLGIQFSNNEDFLKQCLDKAGICVLHAPLFHPAMKNVAPIRRELGVKTFFNMLGPMVNPSFPKHQLVGVFSLELQRLYSYLYQKTDTNYTIVHALDGYDEISLTGNTKIVSRDTESLLAPKNLNLKIIAKSDIYGGDSVKKAAEIFTNILDAKGTEAQNNVVCANAGLAIATAKNISHQAGFEMAKEALLSKQAQTTFNLLKSMSN